MYKQKGLAHIPILVIIIVAVFVGIIALNQKSKQDVQGTQLVHDARSGSGSSGDEDNDEDISSSDDRGDSEGTRIKIESKTEGRQKTEIRFSDEERIKAEVRNDRTKIEVRSGGVKIKYELKNGKLVIKAENEQGEEEELEDEDEVEVEQELEDEGIKIATASGKLVLVKGNIGALTNFPLRIDLSTGQLIASTSAGVRVLTVLPDVAVANMIRAHILSGLGPPFVRFALSGGTPSAQVTSINQTIQLKVKDNKIVYEISGVKDFNLLGFIPITQQLKAIVSAETGQLLETQSSLLTKIIDLLSP